MSKYREMAMEYLQRNYPQDLERMKKEGALEEYLEGIEQDYRVTEKSIFNKMTKELPEDDLKRKQEINRARDVAREVSSSYLNEFVSSN